MRNSSEEKASEGDVDHGFGDIDPLFIISNEATPTRHPSKGSFDDPPAGQHLEAGFVIDAPDDLDHEVI